MKKALVRVLAMIGASVLLSLTVSLVAGTLLRHHVKDGTVLQMNLADGVVEYYPPSIRDVFMVPPLTVRDVVDALARAAKDERVTALVARVGDARLGLASFQEIRDAVLAFRASGKRAVAVAETFGEFGPGNGAYFLATAFDEIALQPSGDIGLTGLSSETPFVRGALDKLGVKPRLDHRREYKSAMNVFTETGFTAPHREASERVLESQFAQIVRGIAEGRGLTEDAVRALVAKAPLSADAARAAKLVDTVAYRDEVWDAFRNADGTLPPRLGLGGYLARAGRAADDEGDVVALVYGVGSVHRGRSSWGTLSNEPTMGSDTVAAAFRAAVDDDEVRAILFRVNSPGGSYIASDTIWREVVRARRQGKPVVASMGDIAGSGGYFVAMGADRIVAQPGTVTGSIGVLAGKMVTGALWSRLGVEWGDLDTGPNASMWSPTKDYSPEQWQRLQEFLDRIYADFVDKAADGRALPRERMQEIARGRIWSGEDAKEIGLVDELGGFPVALRAVRELAGIAPDGAVRLRVFPRTKSPVEVALARITGGQEEDEASIATPGDNILAQLRRVPEVRVLLSMLDGQGALRMSEPSAAMW
jgi:protease-4